MLVQLIVELGAQRMRWVEREHAPESFRRLVGRTPLERGSRFDDRVTGKISAFSPNSKKIHIDIDASSINKNVLVDIGIVGDVANVLEQMIAARVWSTRLFNLQRQGRIGTMAPTDGSEARPARS